MLLSGEALSAGTRDLFQAERARLQEDNPAIFSVERGAQLWSEVAGPRMQNLKACDLGLGPGIVAGTFVAMPRWFEDAAQVMDVEERLAWCRRGIQGLDARASWSSGVRPYGDITALTSWLAQESAGRPLEVRLQHPEEKKMVDWGERLFFRRSGSHDYACATCHRESGRRIRLQVLPNLLDPEELRTVMSSWPAYRISQGETRTLRWRIADCLRQQHIEGVSYESPIITALELYLSVRANGVAMDAPSLKR
jgi:sulfur-oxidizing protein SoxA